MINPTPTDVVVDSLATHRATRLITEDTITAPIRDRVFKAFPLGKYPHGPAYIATCPYCSSIYAALAITATHTPQLRFLRPVVYALAIADLTAYLAKRDEGSGWG